MSYVIPCMFMQTYVFAEKKKWLMVVSCRTKYSRLWTTTGK